MLVALSAFYNNFLLVQTKDENNLELFPSFRGFPVDFVPLFNTVHVGFVTAIVVIFKKLS